MPGKRGPYHSPGMGVPVGHPPASGRDVPHEKHLLFIQANERRYNLFRSCEAEAPDPIPDPLA